MMPKRIWALARWFEGRATITAGDFEWAQGSTEYVHIDEYNRVAKALEQATEFFSFYDRGGQGRVSLTLKVEDGPKVGIWWEESAKPELAAYIKEGA